MTEVNTFNPYYHEFGGVRLLSPSFVKEGNLKTADVPPSVSPSVHQSVRPSSDLRDDWMDQYEFQVCNSILCEDDAWHFRFSKFSWMATGGHFANYRNA